MFQSNRGSQTYGGVSGRVTSSGQEGFHCTGIIEMEILMMDASGEAGKRHPGVDAGSPAEPETGDGGVREDWQLCTGVLTCVGV